MKKYIFSQNIKKFFRKQTFFSLGTFVKVTWIHNDDVFSECLIQKKTKFIFASYSHKVIKKDQAEYNTTESPISKEEYELRMKDIILEIVFLEHTFVLKKKGFDFEITITYFKKQNISVLSVKSSIDNTIHLFNYQKWIKEIVGTETTLTEYELHKLFSRKS
jgi:hypothetical protein